MSAGPRPEPPPRAPRQTSRSPACREGWGRVAKPRRGEPSAGAPHDPSQPPLQAGEGQKPSRLIDEIAHLAPESFHLIDEIAELTPESFHLVDEVAELTHVSFHLIDEVAERTHESFHRIDEVARLTLEASYLIETFRAGGD